MTVFPPLCGGCFSAVLCVFALNSCRLVCVHVKESTAMSKKEADSKNDNPKSVLEEWRRSSETKSVVFNNLCITGPDRGSFWATFVVIVVPGIHFATRTFVYSFLMAFDCGSPHSFSF